MSQATLSIPEQQAVAAQVRAVLTVVRGLDEDRLERWIEACERADAIGPFLDPTAWIAGHQKLADLIEASRSLLELRKVLRVVAPEGD